MKEVLLKLMKGKGEKIQVSTLTHYHSSVRTINIILTDIYNVKI